MDYDHPRCIKERIILELIVNQQFSSNISGGNVAVGPGAQVVNAQDVTAV